MSLKNPGGVDGTWLPTWARQCSTEQCSGPMIAMKTICLSESPSALTRSSLKLSCRCGAGMVQDDVQLISSDEGIRRQPGNNVLMDLAPAVRVGISLLPGS